MCSLPTPPVALSEHPVDIGQRTEAIVLAALVRRGYRVLTPFGTNQRYDLETDRIYAIPIEEATSSVGALRVAPTANGQAKRIRWAREYELPE